MEIVLGELKFSLLAGFPDSAFEGTLSASHFEFTADSAPEPAVGLFPSLEKEEEALRILNIEQNTDPIGERFHGILLKGHRFIFLFLRIRRTSYRILVGEMRFRKLLLIQFFYWATFFSFSSPIEAQQDPVQLSRVKFGRIKIEGMRDDWLEIEFRLKGGRSRKIDISNPRFVNRVGVVLNLAFVSNSSGRQRSHFFRSEVLFSTLEAGDDRSIFFYLPPEVVDRDRLPAEPFAYLVELSIGGKELPVRKDHLSSNLNDLKRMGNFRLRVTRDAIENEGNLLPIYKTPFYLLPEKLKDSPAYIW